MKYIGIALLIAAGFVLLTLGLAFLLFRLAFGARKTTEKEMFVLPDTDQYRPYAAEARRMIRAALALPYEPVTIRSDDGLTLFGRCYPAAPDAPWLLLFHGYCSAAERDFCGGLPFGMGMGCNVLLVDERAHGKSGGRCLTLGIRERYDCRRWVDYVIGRAGPDAKIVLYGMSMGAATVLMAAGPELPKNVAGIVADCGYSAPSAILKSVIRSAHLPVFPVYALLRLGCRLFGGFDPEEASAAGAMAHCDTPVLFLHGEDDRFVPCAMGRENCACCRAADKILLTFAAAGHGIYGRPGKIPRGRYGFPGKGAWRRIWNKNDSHFRNMTPSLPLTGCASRRITGRRRTGGSCWRTSGRSIWPCWTMGASLATCSSTTGRASGTTARS